MWPSAARNDIFSTTILTNCCGSVLHAGEEGGETVVDESRPIDQCLFVFTCRQSLRFKRDTQWDWAQMTRCLSRICVTVTYRTQALCHGQSLTMCALVISVSDCFLIPVCETYTSYYRGDQVLLFPAICEAYAASDYIVVINERKFVQLD